MVSPLGLGQVVSVSGVRRLRYLPLGKEFYSRLRSIVRWEVKRQLRSAEMGKRGEAVTLRDVLNTEPAGEPEDAARVRLHRIVGEMEQMLGEKVSLQEMVAWTAHAYCAAAIRKAGGNRKRAAQLLGVHRNTLSRIMSRVGG